MAQTKGHAVIVGRLGKEPEMRYTPEGIALIEMSLAYDLGYGDRRRTQWITAVLFDKEGRRAEFIAKQVKGTLFQVIGEPYVEEFDRRDGGKGMSFKIKVADFLLLSKPGGKQEEIDDGGARF